MKRTTVSSTVTVLLLTLLQLSIPVQGTDSEIEEYSISYVFHGLADQNDYLKISKHDWDKDSQITITIRTNEPVISIETKNIRNLEISLQYLFEDYSSFFEDVYNEKGYDVKVDDDLFSIWSRALHFQFTSNYPLSTFVIRQYPTIPEIVEVNDIVYEMDEISFDNTTETLVIYPPLSSDLDINIYQKGDDSPISLWDIVFKSNDKKTGNSDDSRGSDADGKDSVTTSYWFPIITSVVVLVMLAIVITWLVRKRRKSGKTE